MRYSILVLLLLSGCATLPAPKMKQDLMVHDYVINWAQKLCEEQAGSSLHYIVPIQTPRYDGGWAEMCEDVYKIRCQNDYLIELNTGASCCDCVGKMQWDETIKEDAKLKLKL